MLDIIVCGGGPVGSHIACELSKKGHSVTVLEKRERLGGNVCCTGIISLECVKNFEIPEHLIIRRFSSAKVFSPAGNVLEISSPELVACITDRATFDTYMSERAIMAGADYRFGKEVTSIAIEKNAVEVTAEFNKGTQKLEAKAVVVASGANSGLLRKIGIREASDIVVGVQSEVFTPYLTSIEIYPGRFAQDFFAWVVPTRESKALAGLLARKNPAGYFGEFLNFLDKEGKIEGKGKPCLRPIALRACTKTYGERAIIVGGAAGQVKPTTGGGIYYGLLSAGIAAEVLHQALEKNDFSAQNLSAYELKWKRKLGREINTGRLLRTIYERLSDKQIDFLLNMVKSSGICGGFWGSDDICFDWHGKSLINLLKHTLKPFALSKT